MSVCALYLFAECVLVFLCFLLSLCACMHVRICSEIIIYRCFALLCFFFFCFQHVILCCCLFASYFIFLYVWLFIFFVAYYCYECVCVCARFRKICCVLKFKVLQRAEMMLKRISPLLMMFIHVSSIS